MEKASQEDFMVYCVMNHKEHIFTVPFAEVEKFCNEKKPVDWEIIHRDNWEEYQKKATERFLDHHGMVRAVNTLQGMYKNQPAELEQSEYFILAKKRYMDPKVSYFDDPATLIASFKRTIERCKGAAGVNPDENSFDELRARIKNYEDVFVFTKKESPGFINKYQARFGHNSDWPQLVDTLQNKNQRKYIIVFAGEYQVNSREPQHGLRILPKRNKEDLLRLVLGANLGSQKTEFILAQKNARWLRTPGLFEHRTAHIKTPAARQRFGEMLGFDKSKITPMKRMRLQDLGTPNSPIKFTGVQQARPEPRQVPMHNGKPRRAVIKRPPPRARGLV